MLLLRQERENRSVYEPTQFGDEAESSGVFRSGPNEFTAGDCRNV